MAANFSRSIFIRLDAFRANPRTACRDNARQIEHLITTITQVCFVQPLLVDASDQLIAGKNRIEAVRPLELEDPQ